MPAPLLHVRHETPFGAVSSIVYESATMLRFETLFLASNGEQVEVTEVETFGEAEALAAIITGAEPEHVRAWIRAHSTWSSFMD